MTGQGDLNAAIADLWARQRPEMLHRVDIVEDAVASLLEAELQPEQQAEAASAAHKIAGSAGSFGFDQASEHAREIELALRGGVALEDAPRLSELVLAIRREFGPDTAATRERVPSTGAFDAAAFTADVLIVCADRLRVRDIQAELTRRGLQAARARPGDEMALRSNAPVAVVDLADPLTRSFLDAAKDDAGVTLIGLANDPGLDERVTFTRGGGRMLLPSNLPAREIAEAVVAMRERLTEEGTRVLAVDDDPTVLELITTILGGHGLEVSSLDDPARFWQTLEVVDPDVLVLDVEMPGFSGIELCRAVRADPRWGTLPVLFLTARREPEIVRAVYDAGADDYMTKPVVDEELVQRIQNRLERVRLLRDLAGRDGLTGVANRRHATEQLARLERLAKRYGQPLTLAILDLDHFKQVNDSYGHEMGDEVLRRLGRKLQNEFRGEDVVGRWGGEEFVVGMYGMPGEVAVDRMRTLLDDWKRERFKDSFGGEFGASFTAGVAELPSSAESLDELQRTADEALYRGKAAGRSRVQGAGERAAADTETVDIAVVEDDSALVDLLTYSLSTQGWSVRVLDDGPTAVAALASEPPLLRARVVLLDWDLPGLDGIAVLRRLRERGVLRETRVVMVTAHGAESEVLKSLELGASDHIPKPFSVPVLVQKVRQVLATR